jgi:hypothetical protein
VGETYDFGSRSALDLSLVTHTFVLRAGAKAAVTVDRLQPSCHCTQAVPVGGTDGYGRFTIAAATEAKIAVTFNPGDMAPGVVEKEVYVFVNGQSTPDVTLHIRGVITPPVVFSVSALDFGRVPVGEDRMLMLTVTYDPHLTVSGQTVALACSDPRLHLTQEAVPLSSAAAAHELKYRITVPAGIAPGKIRGTLFLAVTPGDGAKTSPWSIPVQGEVFAPNTEH